MTSWRIELLIIQGRDAPRSQIFPRNEISIVPGRLVIISFSYDFPGVSSISSFAKYPQDFLSVAFIWHLTSAHAIAPCASDINRHLLSCVLHCARRGRYRSPCRGVFIASLGRQDMSIIPINRPYGSLWSQVDFITRRGTMSAANMKSMRSKVSQRVGGGGGPEAWEWLGGGWPCLTQEVRVPPAGLSPFLDHSPWEGAGSKHLSPGGPPAPCPALAPGRLAVREKCQGHLLGRAPEHKPGCEAVLVIGLL